MNGRAVRSSPHHLKLELPKIYPITDTRIAGIPMVEQVERLIAGGAVFIQLREKHASSRDFYESAEKAIAIARPKGVRIIINDRVDIALALQADGVHLGQDDLPAADARRILGDKAIMGLSTHNPEQVRAALGLPVDYIAIGPIFSTSTKENPDPAVGLDGLSKVREMAGEFPLVAIGGIGEADVGAVLAAGADSAAVISGLVAEPGLIAEKMRTFLEMTI